MRNFAQYCNAELRKAIADANAARPSERQACVKRCMDLPTALGIYLDTRFFHANKPATYAISCVKGWYPTIVEAYYARKEVEARHV